MTPLSRRTFLTGTAAAFARPTFASNAFQLGNGELITLSDGTFAFPPDFWAGASEAEKAELGERVVSKGPSRYRKPGRT